jgi:hypothetical protein
MIVIEFVVVLVLLIMSFETGKHHATLAKGLYIFGYYRRKRYAEMLRRTTIREIDLGYPVTNSEWLDKVKPRGKDLSHSSICEPICYLCNNQYEGTYHATLREGREFGKKVCPKCLPKLREAKRLTPEEHLINVQRNAWNKELIKSAFSV